MKNTTAFIYILLSGIIIPEVAFAHPGHGHNEQVHYFMHGDQVIVLLGTVLSLVAAYIIERLIRKFI